jgi:peptidyl-prolyl cis-trans isomerase D
MLKTFRKEGVQKKILWVLAAIIIISFVFFGVLSPGTGGTTEAGKAFGKKVSIREFEKHYNNTRDQAIMIHGENFFKMSPFLNLEGETWDRIILLHEAKRLNIKVKDSEIVEFLQTLKMFQRDGKFDTLLYNDLLRFIFHRNARDFEEGMRDQLTIMKLFEQVTASLTINEKEIREAYRRDNEKIQISYILFPPSDYADGIDVTEEEAKAYFITHQQEFATEPSVNVKYISLDYPADAKDEDKKATKDKVYDISSKLQDGEKLDAIAKEYNLDVKESGFFSMNQPNIALGWSYDTLEKIFNLKDGETTDPIETATGYQFLTVNERREAVAPEFETSKSKVIETVKTSRAMEIAKERADQSAQKIKEAMAAAPETTFNATAEALNLKVQKTPMFNRGQYLPTIGLSREFQDAAYDLTEKDKLSPAIPTAKGYCILYRDAVTPVEEAEFQKAKDKYGSALIDEKRNQMIVDFISEARLRADVQDNLAKQKNNQQ